MNLTTYLQRIGFDGDVRCDLATLAELHRRHLHAIPYENLDVFLGHLVTIDVEHAFEKLVVRRRGGWCYEMNGLFAWALEEIGFRVTRMAGGVLREKLGDDSVGGHLVLSVLLEEPYVVDVGFGDGLLEPAPLRAGAIRQGGFDFALQRVDGEWWRFINHPRGGAPSFDFRHRETAAEVLAARCSWLQTSPQSPFTQNAVLQRYVGDGYAVLRNTTLQHLGAVSSDPQTIGSLQEYREVLRDLFGLAFPAADQVWERMRANQAAP